MQAMFDSKRAVFEPADVFVIQDALSRARDLLSPGGSLPPDTEAKLAKVIVSLASQRLGRGSEVEAEAVAIEAASFIHQLRALSLLA